MPVPTEALDGRTLLRDSALERLRDAIVDGTLSPGEQLRDTELERWLGVSRTPIREALLTLARDGLVVARAGRSTVVSPIDPAATQDAQRVAAALHELAARDAVVDASVVAVLRERNADFAAALDRGDVDAALDADDAFHAAIVAASGNRVLAAHLDQVTPLLRRVERLRFGSAEGRASVAQHAAIVDALEEGDAVLAGRLSARVWRTLDGHLA